MSDSDNSVGGVGLRLARFFPFRLVALGDAIGRLFGQAYSEAENLSVSEWRVLAVACELGTASARDVAEKTPMDKMAVSRAVASLVDKGYVDRRPSETDRRAAVISPSEAGRGVYARVAVIALAREADVLCALTDEERESLDRILDKLAARVNELRRT